MRRRSERDHSTIQPFSCGILKCIDLKGSNRDDESLSDLDFRCIFSTLELALVQVCPSFLDPSKSNKPSNAGTQDAI